MTDKYLKIMGSVALLAAAGAAHSQTITFPTTNTTGGQFGSDIVLFVSDTTDNEYFTIDTGVSLDSVKTTASIALDGVQTSAIGSIAAPTFSSAVNAALTSYLNTDTNAGDSITWTLVAADSNSQNLGKTAVGATRYLISSATALDGSVAGISRLDNNGVKAAAGLGASVGLQGFFNEVNAAGIPASGVSTTEGWGAGPLGINQPTANAQYGTPVTLTAINSGVASSLQLFLFASNGTTSVGANLYETAANALSLNWTRGGNASITAGGTTPVPLPAAVWLFGSGLLGLFGIGRRKQSA